MPKLNKLSTKGMAKTPDRVGGFRLLPSNMYYGTVKMAYTTESPTSESTCIHLHVEVTEDVDGAKPILLRKQFYVTNGDDGLNYRVKDGVKMLNTNFVTMDELSWIITDASLTDQEYETKKVKMRDFDTQQDIAKDVDCLIDWLDQEIAVCIIHRKSNKTQKSLQGNWEKLNEPQEENVMVKFLDADDLATWNEIEEDAEPTFLTSWLEKNEGKMQDFYRPVSATTKGKPKGAKGGAAGGTERKPLSLGRKRR